MEIHASCAAREGAGVLLMGPSGAGKSDLLLRLIDLGFGMVADDRVVLNGTIARPRHGSEGLIEVRGLGIMRLAFLAQAEVRLAVRLRRGPGERLPLPSRWDLIDVPTIEVDPWLVSAGLRVRLALDCVLGRIEHVAGALTNDV